MLPSRGQHCLGWGDALCWSAHLYIVNCLLYFALLCCVFAFNKHVFENLWKPRLMLFCLWTLRRTTAGKQYLSEAKSYYIQAWLLTSHWTVGKQWKPVDACPCRAVPLMKELGSIYFLFTRSSGRNHSRHICNYFIKLYKSVNYHE